VEQISDASPSVPGGQQVAQAEPRKPMFTTFFDANEARI